MLVCWTSTQFGPVSYLHDAFLLSKVAMKMIDVVEKCQEPVVCGDGDQLSLINSFLTQNINYILSNLQTLLTAIVLPVTMVFTKSSESSSLLSS